MFVSSGLFLIIVDASFHFFTRQWQMHLGCGFRDNSQLLLGRAISAAEQRSKSRLSFTLFVSFVQSAVVRFVLLVLLYDPFSSFISTSRSNIPVKIAGEPVFFTLVQPWSLFTPGSNTPARHQMRGFPRSQPLSNPLSTPLLIVESAPGSGDRLLSSPSM